MADVNKMPLYQSHKKVRALQIKSVERLVPETGTIILTFENDRYEPAMVDTENKPQPEAGWYYVVYDDGYYSFTPAKAFEDGYTELPAGNFSAINLSNV